MLVGGWLYVLHTNDENTCMHTYIKVIQLSLSNLSTGIIYYRLLYIQKS